MDQLPTLTGFSNQILTTGQANRISLFLHTRQHTPQLLELAAALGLCGPLLVLDGGNCFNTYSVAAALYRNVPSEGGRHAHVTAIMQRIRAARAFTCFQMAALVRKACPPQSKTTTEVVATKERGEGMPVLVLEFLTTFQDENIPLRERTRLLATCLLDLKRLAQGAPVLVTVRLSNAQPLPPELLNGLLAAAGEIWTATANAPDGGEAHGPVISLDAGQPRQAKQLVLFEG